MASLDIDPLAFQSTQLVDPTVSEREKRGSRKKAGGNLIESEPLDKVTSPSQPPDLIPLHSEDANHKLYEVPAASTNLGVGTSKTGQQGTAKSSAAKSSTVSCPSDIMSLVKKPSVSTRGGEGHQRSASFCKAENKSVDVKEHRRADSGQWQPYIPNIFIKNNKCSATSVISEIAEPNTYTHYFVYFP